MQSITGFTDGMKPYRALENAAQQDMTIKNPYKTPMLNGNDFLKPYLLAFVIDIILLGPGVKAVRKTYEKNAAKFIINYLPP